MHLYREYKNAIKQIADLQELAGSGDKEIAELARAEKEELNLRTRELEEELKILLLPKDPNDEKNVIVEIRGAAGGRSQYFRGRLIPDVFAVRHRKRLED